MEADGLAPRERLRGTSVLAAPLVLLAVITLSLAIASASWAAFDHHDIGSDALLAMVVPAAIGLASLLAVRGCFVDVSNGIVRDVAAWCTIRRIDQGLIATARVRPGPWRLYVLELADGTTVKLVGASPQQFPARLLPDARARDLEDLDVLLGPDPG